MINIILYQPEICPNTGNIIRLCHAAKAKLHIIKPIGFELHPKWLKRYAAGKFLSEIPHEIHSSYRHFVKKYGKEKIYYISRYGKKIYSKAHFIKKNTKKVFFMFGRESTGIPMEVLKKNFKTILRIPMNKDARSLNLANSVAIILYECLRQNNFKELSEYEFKKGKNWIFLFNK